MPDARGAAHGDVRFFLACCARPEVSWTDERQRSRSGPISSLDDASDNGHDATDRAGKANRLSSSPDALPDNLHHRVLAHAHVAGNEPIGQPVGMHAAHPLDAGPW